jgi:glutathione S-transferase
MRTLYHQWICPFSRKVRIALGEKKLAFTLVVERVWETRPEFLALNPAGDVPVLIEEDGLIVAEATAIAEFLDETEPEPSLLGYDPIVRAEIRRLVAWFDDKFNREVTVNLVGEKLVKRQMGQQSAPDSRALRTGYSLIGHHLDYLDHLSETRKWLAGDFFSLADVTAAAHLSTIDYLGDVPWGDHLAAKEWYARVKSRPSFRPLLSDIVSEFRPPSHYANLDF